MFAMPGRLQRCNCGHVNNVLPLGAAREIGNRMREALKDRSHCLRTSQALDQLVGNVACIQRRKN